jgi:hypothetical protein
MTEMQSVTSLVEEIHKAADRLDPLKFDAGHRPSADALREELAEMIRRSDPRADGRSNDTLMSVFEALSRAGMALEEAARALIWGYLDHDLARDVLGCEGIPELRQALETSLAEWGGEDVLSGLLNSAYRTLSRKPSLSFETVNRATVVVAAVHEYCRATLEARGVTERDYRRWLARSGRLGHH